MTGTQASADASGEDGGRIELHRDDGVTADSAVRYRIVIDGERRGHIRKGETRRLTVRPGVHQLWLTCYRVWRSPVREVEVSAGETVRMRCRPSAGLQGFRMFDLLNYIRLVQELDQPAGR